MTECSTPECDQDAGKGYLCPHCIRDLDARLAQGRALIPELNVTIAGLDAVRVENVEGCNGDKVAGSKAPLDLRALDVQMSLQQDTQYSAKEYAADPWSAGEAARVIATVITAELMVSGPEGDHIDHAENRARVEEIAPPMPTRALLPWLRKNARIPITSQQIRHWAARGHLTPVEREPVPTYWPHEVIDAYNERRKA